MQFGHCVELPVFNGTLARGPAGLGAVLDLSLCPLSVLLHFIEPVVVHLVHLVLFM